MGKITAFLNSLIMLLKWGVQCTTKRQHNVGFEKKDHERAVAILGNGASLRDTINKGLSKELDYCLVNFSPLSELFFIIKPKYLVLADGAFFFPKQKEHIDKVTQMMMVLKKVDWRLTVFVPVTYYHEAKLKYQQNDNISVAAFNQNEIKDEFTFKKLEYKLFQKGLAAPVYMNVGVAALYCLINSGYQKIFLYGMEHSWVKLLSVDKDNYVCMNDVHYYDKEKEHVIRMYVGGRPERFHEQLRYQATTFATYWVLKGYAEFLGNVEIINKTKDSFIDAFKKEYE